MKLTTLLKIIALIIAISTTFERKIKTNKVGYEDRDITDDEVDTIASTVPNFTAPNKWRKKISKITQYSKDGFINNFLIPGSSALENENGLRVIVNNQSDLAKIDAEVNIKPLNQGKNRQQRHDEMLALYRMNETTAATLKDDRYIEIKGGKKFDRFHEYIHILSAPGGRSNAQENCGPLNEGLINYFTEQLFTSINEEVITRYPKQTDAVKIAVGHLNTNGKKGDELAFKAAFKGEFENFLRELSGSFVTALPNNKTKPFTKKSFTADQFYDELTDTWCKGKYASIKSLGLQSN